MCSYHDFALAEGNPASDGKVTADVPFWGGPRGINTTGLTRGARVYTHGNSSLRGDLDPLSPHAGAVLQTSGGDWTHRLSSIGPGLPGDSGSGFVDAQGRVVGVLSIIRFFPLPRRTTSRT